MFSGWQMQLDGAHLGVAVYVKLGFNWANGVSVSDICVPWAGIDMCL